MEKKQSSVEQLELDLEIWFTLSGMHFPIEIKNSIERVKAMHKKEIEDAVNFGDEHGQITTYLTVEKYYNETFGETKK